MSSKASNTGSGPETGRLKTGDIVRIIDDEEKVKNLQDNHGGYNIKMKHYLGKVGQIIKMDSDGDLYVKFGSRWFVYNPMCCLPAAGEKIYERSDDDDDSENITINQSDLHSALMMMILSGLGENMSETMSLPVLFAATVKGDINMVRRVLNNSPELMNALHHDLTALSIASHQGHREIVLELLKRDAEIDKADKQGNTPLIASIAGKEPAIAKLLIDKGADVKITNNDGRTALHCASLADYSSLVEIIIGKGCDVNSQDSDGDTALHDAIFKGNNDSIDVLCRQTDLNPGTVNKKGFNILHLASLRDRAFAVDKIIDKHKSLVKAKTQDGYTALHIAAVNNHTDCAKLLIEKGNAEINSKDLEGHTPLMFAALEGYLECVQLLIKKGADVNLVDRKKRTALHASCIGKNSQGGAEQLLAGMLGLSINSNTEDRLKVAKFLIENGARTDLKDGDGDTAVECCQDQNMKRSLSQFIRQRQGGGSAEFSSTSTGTGTGAAAEPETIGELLGIRLPCKRCMSKPATITLLPCAHKCVCRECALQANKCPACHQDIHRRVATRGNPTENPECCVQ